MRWGEVGGAKRGNGIGQVRLGEVKSSGEGQSGQGAWGGGVRLGLGLGG